MGKTKDTPDANAPADETKPAQFDITTALADAIKALSPEDLARVLKQAQAVPTTMGMDQATLQSIVTAFQATSATAVRETLRQERKENPNYPERSVFNPGGVYDDQGKSLAPKVKFRRPTFYCGVHLGGELETSNEIELCNRITESKTAGPDGKWEAVVTDRGKPGERLVIKVPSKTIDERMGLPTFSHILRALLEGDDAINADTMAARIANLEAQLKAALAAGTLAAPSGA